MDRISLNRIRLFENDYTITGEHATKLKFLVNNAHLYNTYIDVYMNSIIIGYVFDKKAPKNNMGTEKARIYADAFSNKREECLFIYRLITLLDQENLTIEERLNRAFRYDTDAKNNIILQELLETINDYSRGGIDIMFEIFTNKCTSQEDYINKSYEEIEKFKLSFEGVSSDITKNEFFRK